MANSERKSVLSKLVAYSHRLRFSRVKIAPSIPNDGLCKKGNDNLERTDVQKAIQKLLGKDISMQILEKIFMKLDKDKNGLFDQAEFRQMATDILNEEGQNRVAILKSKTDTKTRLRKIAKKVYSTKDLLCIQDSSLSRFILHL